MRIDQAGVRTEKVWFNFSPDRVHSARYTGQDHTVRPRGHERRSQIDIVFEKVVSHVAPTTD